MEHTLSNSMVVMYVQGSSSQVFPNQGGSSSHPQSHADVPSANCWYYYSWSLLSFQCSTRSIQLPILLHLHHIMSHHHHLHHFHILLHAPGYGFGYIGSNTSSGSQSQNSLPSSHNSFQSRPYYGGSQRNNGGYKYNKGRGNNGGYKQG